MRSGEKFGLENAGMYHLLRQYPLDTEMRKLLIIFPLQFLN